MSGGLIKVDMTLGFDDGAADAETKLVQAIASGDVDGGWPSTRAFANAGIRGLEAVEAPLTISSYAASKALVSGPVARDLLAQLDGSGIKGLALAVGPLRRPFAAQAPLLGGAGLEGHHVPVVQLAGPGGHDPGARRDTGQLRAPTGRTRLRPGRCAASSSTSPSTRRTAAPRRRS